jgi:uncharacterized membrane protein YbhN (UPF0104 family)
VLGAVVWYVDPKALLQQLGKVNPWWFALATLASILANLVSAARWCVIARLLGLAAPFARMVAMYFRGVTLNVLLPGATVSGDLLRSYELSRRNNPLVRSGLSVLLDRLSGLWMLCALSLVSLLGAAATGMLSKMSNEGFYLYVGLLLVSLVIPWVPLPVKKIEELRTSIVHSGGPLLRSAWLSAGVQVASSFALWLCGLAAGVNLSYPLMLAAAAPIFIMAAVPLGWAGFGARELSAVVVLGLLGVPADQAATCALLYGLAAVVQGALAAPLFFFKE